MVHAGAWTWQGGRWRCGVGGMGNGVRSEMGRRQAAVVAAGISRAAAAPGALQAAAMYLDELSANANQLKWDGAELANVNGTENGSCDVVLDQTCVFTI